MKLFLFLIIVLGVLAYGDITCDADVKDEPEGPKSGAKGTGPTAPRKAGESKISWENQLDEPMWVQFDCDRQLITSDTTKYTEDFSVAYDGISADTSFSQEEKKEYMYQLADKSGKYSKVGPHDYLEEKAPNCMDDLIYATIFNFGSTGSPNYFLNLSGMDQGGQIVISGDIDNPHSEKDDKICFEENCGCIRGWCWSYCSFGANWCYTTKGSSQDRNWVKCTKHRECMPDWHCAGACTV